MHAALRAAAGQLAASTPELSRVGYFGSYARGDWGVGSDLDVIIELSSSDLPFERRAVAFDFTGLPVGAEVLVYTAEELREQLTARTRFGRELANAVWVYPADPVL